MVSTSTNARRQIWRSLTFNADHKVEPKGLAWRSSTVFIIATVTIGIFSDTFLHSIIVPILPFVLKDRINVPPEKVQSTVDNLLSAYAMASVFLSPFAGAIADRTSSRQTPYLLGLVALILSTFMWYFGQTVLVLTIARIAQGASCAFVFSVGLAMCIDTVGPEKLGKTIGTMFSFVSFGGLCAPIVGGILYEKAGYEAVSAVSISILGLDLLMRLFVIEKSTAAHFNTPRRNFSDPENGSTENRVSGEDEEGIGYDILRETTPLLSSTQHLHDDRYLIPDNQPAILRQIPLLYCLCHSPSLLLAQLVALSQATLLSAFNATVPTFAAETFGFGSFKSSLLFIPLGVLNLIVGPIGGWAADRYGTKFVAVTGFGLLTPALALLRLPVAEPFLQQVTLYAGILALCGLGLPLLGTSSIVEAGRVVGKYHRHNPDFFSKQGPYAQLYSINHTVFSLGLSIGPVLAGGLKESIGYGNMNAVLAAISGVTTLLCFVWLGGEPKLPIIKSL